MKKLANVMDFPISIKDNICITGTKTTCASKILENFVAPYTATVVNRLNNEDAVITGKTNLDEFAMGLTTEFSAYGATKNPWNIDYVPGGSSGGSAASVAANECLASLGSGYWRFCKKSCKFLLSSWSKTNLWINQQIWSHLICKQH